MRLSTLLLLLHQQYPLDTHGPSCCSASDTEQYESCKVKRYSCDVFSFWAEGGESERKNCHLWCQLFLRLFPPFPSTCFLRLSFAVLCFFCHSSLFLSLSLLSFAVFLECKCDAKTRNHSSTKEMFCLPCRCFSSFKNSKNIGTSINITDQRVNIDKHWKQQRWWQVDSAEKHWVATAPLLRKLKALLAARCFVDVTELVGPGLAGRPRDEAQTRINQRGIF